jgi:hypothetical protein
MQDAESRVITWSQVQAGKIIKNAANKAEVERYRQFKIAKMLVSEMEETNRMWEDFEMEET